MNKKIIVLTIVLVALVVAGKIAYDQSTKVCCGPAPEIQNNILQKFSNNKSNFELTYTSDNGSVPPDYYRENTVKVVTDKDGSPSGSLKVEDYKKVLEEKKLAVSDEQLTRIMEDAAQVKPTSNPVKTLGCTGGGNKSLSIYLGGDDRIFNVSSYSCADQASNESLEAFAEKFEATLGI